MSTKRLAEVSAADRQEIADFADLLRANAGTPPTNEAPEPVCILVRGRRRTGYNRIDHSAGNAGR